MKKALLRMHRTAISGYVVLIIQTAGQHTACGTRSPTAAAAPAVRAILRLSLEVSGFCPGTRPRHKTVLTHAVLYRSQTIREGGNILLHSA
jgi:hypothetical protein